MVRRRKASPLVFLIAALVVLITGWWQNRSGPPASPVNAGRASTRPAESAPPELQQTLQLIQKGGPFPYAKDGAVFANREGRLPARPAGYYREYTVPTPGAPNRGARRVIQGRDGDTWYTSDHYRTFVRIDE